MVRYGVYTNKYRYISICSQIMIMFHYHQESKHQYIIIIN